MAETDILNPVRGWWKQINDNPNPSYGYTRRSANNNALAKARLGAPYSRETLNQGFAFEFNYVDRPWTTILRLKHFYEQFKGGYFTYIDWDGGGRHHVGRFTSPVNAMETANDKYTVQGLVFEEMPQARMVSYPADFVNWSRCINVLDDFLNPTVALYSSTGVAWISQLNPDLAGASATNPAAYEISNPAPAVGDWAQVEYVGWGFTMTFRTNAAFGNALLYIDGVKVLSMNMATGAQLAIGGSMALPAGMTFAAGVVTATNMPLDKHRVKVVANGPSSGANVGVIYPPIKVIV
jgi:hypothetical protein